MKRGKLKLVLGVKGWTKVGQSARTQPQTIQENVAPETERRSARGKGRKRVLVFMEAQYRPT